MEAAELHQVVEVYVPADGWKFSTVPLTESEAVASVVVELLPDHQVVVVTVPALGRLTLTVPETESEAVASVVVLLDPP